MGIIKPSDRQLQRDLDLGGRILQNRKPNHEIEGPKTQRTKIDINGESF